MIELVQARKATPRIDHPDELARIVRRIVAEVEPVAVYLFGSRARGDAHADSDYDLMVVLPDEASPGRELRDRIWQAARAGRIGATPFLSREAAFAWRRHEVGTLEHEVEVDGIQLYPPLRSALPHAAPGGGRRAMNTTVVEEWLGRAEKDLAVVRLCCDADDPLPDQAAYHIQQAAEKLVKAALVAHRIRPRKGHRIEEFTPLLPDGFPLKERFRRLERFSDFAWAYRYPEYPGQEPIPEPTAGDARAWLAEVATLKADFEQWLKARAGEGPVP